MNSRLQHRITSSMPSQAQVTELSQKVGRALAKFLATSFLIFWVSAALYGVFYYTYMPKVSFEVPVHLQYDPECAHGKKQPCQFPFGKFSLLHPRSEEDFFRVGQDYELVLEMEMPESELNQEVGIFMAELVLNNQKMSAVKSVQRSASLKYKSSLLKTIETLIFSPLFLGGYKSEVQTVQVALGDFSPSLSNPVTTGCVTLKSREVAVYAARFVSHARFEGVRYWLFYYPMTVSVLATVTIFAFLMLIFVFASMAKDFTSSRRRSQPSRPQVVPQEPEEEEERPLAASSRDDAPADVPVPEKPVETVGAQNEEEDDVVGDAHTPAVTPTPLERNRSSESESADYMVIEEEK